MRTNAPYLAPTHARVGRCTLRVLTPVLLVLAAPLAAQVHQDGGPLSERSTNAGNDSAPVHERGRSVRDGSAGELGGNPVRGSSTGTVLSGPVADVTVGSATIHQGVSGTGTMTDASVGAVTKDVASPLREVISQPINQLRPLQEQLRSVRPLAPDESPPSDEPAAEDTTDVTAESQDDRDTLQADPLLTPPEVSEPQAPDADQDAGTAGDGQGGATPSEASEDGSATAPPREEAAPPDTQQAAAPQDEAAPAEEMEASETAPTPAGAPAAR